MVSEAPLGEYRETNFKKYTVESVEMQRVSY
jgi:hypothetical protein